MFDTTISLGIVIQTIALIASGIYFIWSLRSRLDIMDIKQSTIVDKVGKIEMELDKITDVIIEQTKHSQRLDNFEVRLQEFANRMFSVDKRTTKR